MVVAEAVPVEVRLMPGAQSEFFMSKARHPLLAGGRASGKTWGLVARVFAYMDGHPGARGCLTEPVFGMIKRNLVPVIEAQFGGGGGALAKGAFWEFRGWQDRTPTEVVFSNGSLLDLRPADAQNAYKFRGATYAVFGMDEAAIGEQHETFMNLQPCLRQPGYAHQGWVVTTPHFRSPWIRQRWEQHVNPETGAALTAREYPFFQARMEDNLYLTEEDKAHWWESYGDSPLARQELGGEFLAVIGAGFPMFGATHIRDPEPGLRRRVVGLDFGAASPTAMVLLEEDDAGRVWVTREFYKRRADDYDWVREVAEWQGDGQLRVRCDPSRSESELQSLRLMYGVNLTRARVKRFDDRVRMLSSRLTVRDGSARMFISSSCPNLISEIRNLAFAERPGGGGICDSWMPGLADHAFDALCYGLSEIDVGFPQLVPVTVRWEL